MMKKLAKSPSTSSRRGFVTGSAAALAGAAAGPLVAKAGAENADGGQTKTLKSWLTSEYDLKPSYIVGHKSFYRLWQTVELFDPEGEVAGRNQWRGDFQRLVESVSPSGKAAERITWNTVGTRNWNVKDETYAPHTPLPWSTGFSYPFSSEDNYDELKMDYSSIPKDALGVTFRQGFTVTAHYEFDFMRSSRHATIEKLRRVGNMLLHTPEEGQRFSFTFPPAVTNSKLQRKHVHIGILGLTHVNGEPCAILDHRQGPMTFEWDTTSGEFSKQQGDPSVETWHMRIRAWQYGTFFVSLEDGRIVEGQLLENHMWMVGPKGGGPPTPRSSRGIWSIRQISSRDFEEGLKDWDFDQSPQVWHCLYQELRRG